MAFNGTEGEFITMEEAQALTGAFRRNNEGAIHGYFFGREKLLQLLGQSGAIGLRVYFGEDKNGVNKLVLLAAGQDLNNLESLILDVGSPCPTLCSPSGKP